MHASAVRDVVDRAGDGDDSARARARPRGPARRPTGLADRLDAADLAPAARQRRDLGRVAADDRDLAARRATGARSRCDSVVAPAPTGSSTTGTPARFAARPASSIDSTQASESVPMLSTSAEAAARHLLDLLQRVRHHRQRAERERRVRGLVHDHVVRDLVDERLALTDRGEVGAGRLTRRLAGRRPGRRPAPISGSPCATAREAASAAPRAACSSDSPRASSAASVAECVQPAPCVARTSSRSTGISTCRSPSKRWSTGSPWPPVTITAGAPSSTSRSASSRLGPSPTSNSRLDLVRRHHGREREEPRDERCDGVLLQQPRARARDHHRVDHERHRMLGEEVRDRLDHRRREEHPRLGRVDADVVEDRLQLRRARTPAAARARRPRRRCSAPSARRSRSCRSSRRRRRPSGRPGSRRLHPSRSPRSSDISEPNCTPFAGANRIRFDGCDLSP